VPTKVIGDKVAFLSALYTTSSERPLVIPEATGIGQALVEDLRKRDLRLYTRETYNSRTRLKTDKIGFATTYATKMQLIEHAKYLAGKGALRPAEQETVDEFKVFQYSDSAKRLGAGAPDGFHDDRVMATLLAVWKMEPTDGGRDRIRAELRRIVKDVRRGSRKNHSR
jgi:hypothetical protein